MGVESDQLVFDYLSKVGDLAQTALPAKERMRLVARLRNDIDRERRDDDSPAGVKRILGRLGSPDEVVLAAGGAGEDRGRGRVPSQRDPGRSPGPGRNPDAGRSAEPGWGVPDPRPQSPRIPSAPDGQPPRTGPRTGSGGTEWWRVAPGGRTAPDDGLPDLPPGVSGWMKLPLDLPEDAKNSPGAEGTDGGAGEAAGGPEADAETADGEKSGKRSTGYRRRLLRRRRRAATAPAAPAQPEPAPRRRFGLVGGAVMETLAALLLVAGAVFGSWVALALGWLMAYYSRRLSPTAAKFAALGLPGLVLGGMMVWLWGRMDGRWGTPIAQGQLGAAVSDSFPTMVRIAAVGSALFLLWRSRRVR